jgi:hypothetical protein
MNASDLVVETRVPFRYGVTSGVLVGSATASIPLTLDARTRFELHSIVATSNADVKTQVANNYFSVLIAQLNGQAWSSLSVLQEAISQQSNVPWEFKPHVILPARFQMMFTFTDLGAGGTHYVELIGFMLY